MNLVRSVMSVFLLILVAVAIAGWIWAGNQPAATQWGARAVLAICGAAAIASVIRLWMVKPAPLDESREVQRAI